MILVVGDVVDDIGVRPLEPVTPRSDTRAEIVMTPGGSAANTAAWIADLGTPVRFIGRAGADGVDRHRDALAHYGVDARIAADPGRPTATIVLTLDGAGDRTMYVDRGANSGLTLTDVPADAWDGITWLHVSGYTLFDPATRSVAIDLLSAAVGRGIGTSVDPGSVAFLREVGAPEFLRWTTGVDLLLPNADEARFLTGSTGPYLDVEALTAHYRAVIVTLGATGAMYAAADGTRDQVVAPRVDVQDTTGAGDAFTAGFLAAQHAGAAPRAALAAGAAAAERCVTRRGARPA